MKSRYVSLRKNPAGSPENKKISYPGKGTRFGKHLFITCLKIEYTLWKIFLEKHFSVVWQMSNSFKEVTGILCHHEVHPSIEFCVESIASFSLVLFC